MITIVSNAQSVETPALLALSDVRAFGLAAYYAVC
jgi:hypothetical protein